MTKILVLLIKIGDYMEEDVKSCIFCCYCDDNYHDWKKYCVRHDSFIDNYDICNDYYEY